MPDEELVYEELFEEMRIWYNNGWIKNDAATSTSDKDIWAVGNYLSGHGEYLPYSELNAQGVYTGETIYALNVCQPRMSTTQITMCGTADPSTYGDPEKAMEFINRLNSVGAQDIVAEVQRQYDAWKANK